MNGKLHLGHAFTLTKADFSAYFHRLIGDRVLFPFAFHCTGMPIQGAANRLAREMAEAGVCVRVCLFARASVFLCVDCVCHTWKCARVCLCVHVCVLVCAYVFVFYF